MLCELRIENLALISSLELQLDSGEQGGLVVMTGETGAGKSIMLRALHLLAGGRGSAEWIRSGAEQCIIEALFEVSPTNLHLLERLEESGFGRDTTVIVRRVITHAGRSRLYVNGSLATVRQVAELTGELLTVAGQHDQQRLLQPGTHLDFLDLYGDLWRERQEVTSLYADWQELSQELRELRRQEQDKEQRRDFLVYQLAEIEAAALRPGEDEELATEKKRLKSSDALIKLSQESYHLLAGQLLDGLTSLRRNLEQIVGLDPGAEQMVEEIAGFTFQAEDYATILREYRDGLETDPLRLEQVIERLDTIQSLKRKYGEHLADVLAYAEEVAAELARIESMDREIEELKQKVAGMESQLRKAADSLHEKRRSAAARMEQAMAGELASLAFNQAGFQVCFQEVEKAMASLRASGWDRLEFFFTANPGEPPRPLAKIASGGELSRLMLAMKCLLAKRDMVDTVIFDEVDAGIGGQAAEAVAQKIQELASHHQVLCITHLPQIAARGTLHFQVVKVTEDGRTMTRVEKLTNTHRVKELARMLAGDSAGEKTQAWARELLRIGGAAGI